jgi:inner membrane protein
VDNVIGLATANPFWVWAALGAGLLACEVALGSGWMLWPAASAGVVAVISTIHPLGWLPSIAVFAAMTIVSTMAARNLVPGLAGEAGHDVNDNVARLVGHHGRTVAAFSGRTGRVFIDGKEWAAELDDDTALDGGASVEVTGVRGAHLKVRPSA